MPPDNNAFRQQQQQKPSTSTNNDSTSSPESASNNASEAMNRPSVEAPNNIVAAADIDDDNVEPLGAAAAAAAPPNDEEFELMNDEADELENQDDQDERIEGCGWQGTYSTVKGRIAHLFNNALLSDATFLVGRGPQRQKMYAHKFILAVGSPVFDAMFNGPMRSAQQVVELPDVEPAAFHALLKLLYTDKAEITRHSVMSTLYTAKKYAVPSLENHCVNFLKTNLRANNAFLLLTQARLFDEKQLAGLCLDIVDRHTSEALDAESFLDIDHDTLLAVLERDSLQVRESRLFTAVLRWADQECSRQSLPATAENRRLVLGAALHLIRYPIMTLEDFANGPAQSAVLTDRQVVNLFLYFTVNPKPHTEFLDVPRNCYTGKEHIISRFSHTDSRWGYSNTPDRIRFSVDRHIFIIGLGLFGSVHGVADYEATLEIVHTSSQRVVAHHKTSFTSDGNQQTYRVMFSRPVGIQPNEQYLISVTLKGPDSNYGTGGHPRVVKDNGAEGRTSFSFFFSPGNNNGTSVQDGQIPEIIYYVCGKSNGSDVCGSAGALSGGIDGSAFGQLFQ